ncbi:probable inactive poly [ADP-ribose] polymerase SRO3 [Phalaenopsis equestris]|uniref:probable inactive poly [ADP-ribose] polymerase SRO3 n=1 Tax=Phalaenopsis equestris TaxID=78828 RepID=UPI0009E5CA32|nr:probable inactive poly [ADP-ribose] polymerase SRO3 [Phalaenopsis equestris]
MEHSVSSELTARTGKARVDMASFQRSDLSIGFLPADNRLVRAFNNFKKSGVPSRFLLFSEGAWEDLERNVFDELKAGFLAGKTSLKIAACEKSHLFDFLRMTRIDLNTGKWNSIGWIDVHGKCFFPGIEKEILSESLGGFRVFQKGHHHVHCRKELCDENAEVSSNRWPDTKLLRKDDKFYKVVEKLFLSGMKRFIPDTVITSIHKCSHSSSSANSRLLTFQFHRKQAVEARGHCNIKFGWFGSSASSVSAILSDGFRQTNSARPGVCNHGFGIHLSSPHSPYDSAMLSEADENGEKHLLLCRVIMGKSEKIEAGSIQDHPSHADFDTGVDDIVNPKWYVVWNTHIRTHIVPDFVVSFRSSGNSGGLRKPIGVQKLSSLTNLPFWKLFAEIGRCLPSSKMQALEVFYNQYKVGEISKDIFIRYMRSIAGDQLLTSTIKRLSAC